MKTTHFPAINAQVAQAALACGRNPESVRLIAVSKTVDASVASCAFAQGARDFGENRPEQLVEKAQAIQEARWHFIGNIQSRRIPEIVSSATLIHSLFQASHADKIQVAAQSIGKVQDVLIEVNVSGEQSKGGCSPDEALELVQHCCSLANVCVRGLMTMAPQGNSYEALQCFEQLASLKSAIHDKLDPEYASGFTELSMGMSEDWRQAIAAGSTMVRIGRAIFSDSFTELK